MPLSGPKFDVISNVRNSICVVIRIHLNLCSYDGAHEILDIFLSKFCSLHVIMSKFLYLHIDTSLDFFFLACFLSI